MILSSSSPCKTAAGFDVLAGARASSPIAAEHAWREPGVGRDIDIALSRWTRNGAQTLEVANDCGENWHCIGINLKCTSLTFSHAGRTLVEGRLTAGTAQITAPGVACCAVFGAPSDVLHLFASQTVLAECYADLFGRPHAGDIVIDDPRLIRDAALERLGQALAVSHTEHAALGKVFADSISLAIVSRVVLRHFSTNRSEVRGAAALPSWRMRRVVEFVEANLAEPIGLADMAESVGLTRMHFAAQFRRATGLRPHEYLMRRRIERAQQLLLESRDGLLDVALGCGFRSQAHFTTVFKRFVGETPFCWRAKTNVDQ
ncbi:helix-turn-helix domain-containing protein [Burkholderia vietnamiensis]|uniref:helix-turn-helix domain-containing protein n=1 Tax=Burkholderia vietnamiensis TaxID=60552 RepID=UPI000756818B|nr:AraC family transcriptional regulator [Burkholderia vietnamiensis]KVE05057.1 AraC family transcriptional regulator [Burkholderia vietnamiensis]KVE66591.1 AraC family transcriptional regulator [Burkholderia vietnamiensis]KVF06149.1 AraC family transcriptional regulator [Burkholderia vietnamiensis]HDR9037878.1 helix-turn-helix transcriptional regulator [Burkholderia vietnamiensis]HDR9224337.1 helix-turn-helix transcriptional regulator [Burkholderia vietnamiensis]